METRKILIANNKTQRRYEITTNATTLGELQDQMTAQGIDFTGMTFTEGISKTQLLSRESLLPTNVMFKGQPTNDLVMLLTNPNKQIASGAGDRKEAYRLVKELGLAEAIKEGEGDNFTRCKTETLWGYINIACNGTSNSKEDIEEVREELKNIDKDEKEVENISAPEKKLPDVKTAPHPEVVEWYYMGVKAMAKNGLLCPSDVAVIADLTTELYKKLMEEKPRISDDDIDDMIASI